MKGHFTYRRPGKKKRNMGKQQDVQYTRPPVVSYMNDFVPVAAVDPLTNNAETYYNVDDGWVDDTLDNQTTVYGARIQKEETAMDQARVDFLKKHLISEYYVPHNNVCSCNNAIATHLCRTCGDNITKCEECMYLAHRDLPPHQILAYNEETGLLLAHTRPVINLKSTRSCFCSCYPFSTTSVLIVDITGTFYFEPYISYHSSICSNRHYSLYLWRTFLRVGQEWLLSEFGHQTNSGFHQKLSETIPPTVTWGKDFKARICRDPN
jgi:hypothetical protein